MARGGHNFIDLTNQVFGELKALSYNKGTKTTPSTWTCQCSCENTVDIPGYALRAGTYKSCGCKRIKKRDAGVKKHIESDRVEGTRKSALNTKLHSGNKSGVKGVRWDDNKQRWKAYIGFRGRQISLGSYKDFESAVKARKRGEEQYHKPILEDK